MLKSIYIDNFRHFKNFTLELKDEKNLLCGLNGTGKTSILEILFRLQCFLINSLPINSLCSFNDIPRWGKLDYGNTKSTIGITVIVDDVLYNYKIVIEHEFKNNRSRVIKESLLLDNTKLFLSQMGDAECTSDDNKIFSYPIDWKVSSLNLSSRNNSNIRKFLLYMEKNIYSLSINPFFKGGNCTEFASKEFNNELIAFDGSNFQAWYGKKLDENITIIANTFEKIKPFIKGFKQFVYLQENFEKVLYVDMIDKDNSSYRLYFNELSHGQKILCILYMVLNLCPKDSVICIDEFENFLSPLELQPLYNLIQDVYEEKNVQCILVSHHQLTMNWFRNNAIIFKYSDDNSFICLDYFSEENINKISIEEYLYNLEDF